MFISSWYVHKISAMAIKVCRTDKLQGHLLNCIWKDKEAWLTNEVRLYLFLILTLSMLGRIIKIRLGFAITNYYSSCIMAVINTTKSWSKSFSIELCTKPTVACFLTFNKLLWWCVDTSGHWLPKTHVETNINSCS